MDAFSSFDNVLGFTVGNEIVNELSQSTVAAYVKAAALDLKRYRDGQGYRRIPVGYSGADVAALMPFLQNYLACGSDSIDFFGQNAYGWCGKSTMTVSGYNYLAGNASGYSIPIFFSETGCKVDSTGRIFTDQASILGPDMNSQWSGAIIYEWSMEANNYGLVSTGAGGTPTPVSPDFTNLKNQWSTLNPTGTPSSRYGANVTPPSCPKSTVSGWAINGDISLPTLKQALVSKSATGTASNTGTLTNLPSLPSQAKTGTSSTGTSTATNGAANQGSQQNPPGGGGLPTGAKVGIAVGIVIVLLVILLVAFLFWKRRRNSTAATPLDLSPEGLEVGSQPPKELHNTSVSVQELPSEHSPPLSTVTPVEVGSSQLASHRQPISELSTSPSVTTTNNSSPQPAMSQISRRAVPSTTSASWANAPWQNDTEPFPEQERRAEDTPFLSTNVEEDELSQIEAEERRIDAQIAESERIRALKEEKAALQAKKASLLESRERGKG